MKKCVYGNIVLYEIKCKLCKEKNLVGDPYGCCPSCNKPFKEEKINKTEIIVGSKRMRPKKATKKRIKDEQDGHCYWCGRLFGEIYEKNNKIMRLRINYDHKIPFSFCKSNHEDNFVGACNVCNTFKSSMVFDDEKICRDYLLRKWDKDLSKGKIKLC